MKVIFIMQIMMNKRPRAVKYAIMCYVIFLPSKPSSTKAMLARYFTKLN